MSIEFLFHSEHTIFFVTLSLLLLCVRTFFFLLYFAPTYSNIQINFAKLKLYDVVIVNKSCYLMLMLKKNKERYI